MKSLRLSDAFINKTNECEFEWTATMYNLNKGKNDALLEKCKPLKDYMTLINYIRENQAYDMTIADAVDEAVKRCIKEDVLSEYLKKHRSEVMGMIITEYNEEVLKKGIREEGRIEGREEGRINAFVQLVLDGTITIQTAAEKAGMDEVSFAEKMQEIS